MAPVATTTRCRPCGHAEADPACPSCILFGTDDEFRAAWGGPPLPRPPDNHVQIALTFQGVGDAIQTLSASHGLKLERPDYRVTFVCCTPGQPAWCELFEGYDELTVRAHPRMRTLRPGSYEAMMCLGAPRWRHYANNCGVREPVLPPARPLPANLLPWAWPHRGKVVLCPGTTDPHRQWPIERWVALQDRIGRERCVAVDNDLSRLGKFAHPMGIVEGPREIAALMLGAAIVVGNDSGMAHVAGTLKVPALVLGNFRKFYDGYGCYPTVCGLQRALHDLPPEEVLPHVTSRLDSASGAKGFDISPYLRPDDPWLVGESAADVRRIYREKHDLAALLRPRRVLEIGVRAGYSAAAFLAGCPAATYLGLDADDTTEHGGWPGAAAQAREMLGRHFPGRASVRVVNTTGLRELPGGDWDLIHVDGNHSFAGALHDLWLAARAGPHWILVDDLDHCPPVAEACNEWLKTVRWSHDLSAVRLPSVRGDLLVQLAAHAHPDAHPG